MGENRYLFKKIGAIKKTFHSKMAIINGRKGKGLTEHKRLKREGESTWKKYTKKVLMTWIKTMVW